MKGPTSRRVAVASTFAERFGGEPEIWCRAPGRVDLMGSHTDYNLGFVLTLPIDRDTWIAARRRGDRRLRVYSMNLGEQVDVDWKTRTRRDGRHWSDYLGAVAAVLEEEQYAVRGFEGVIHSTVPIGGGLSSSAALECAVATVFEALGGWTLGAVRKARLCQRAENTHVGVPCGVLDQYTSCVGEAGCALLLDCRELTSRPVSLGGGLRVVICDTRSKRELAGSAYGERRADCELGARLLALPSLREIDRETFERRESVLPPRVARRCRFIVEENERVIQLAEALSGADRASIGRLCAESYRGATQLYEIGAPAVQAMLEAILGAPGVVGGRQAGAGFGGCLVAFVEEARLEAFCGAVRSDYRAATGLDPAIYAVRAAAGAGRLSLDA